MSMDQQTRQDLEDLYDSIRWSRKAVEDYELTSEVASSLLGDLRRFQNRLSVILVREDHD